MSIMVIDSVCPQAILPAKHVVPLTLYPSGTLCVTYIPFRNCNDTLYCWELSGEYAGEDLRSLRSTVLKYDNEKLENCRFCEKFDIWPLISGSYVDLGPNNSQPIASTRRDQSAGFFPLSYTTLSFETHEGRIDPPPPARHRYQNRRARVRVKENCLDYGCLELGYCM